MSHRFTRRHFLGLGLATAALAATPNLYRLIAADTPVSNRNPYYPPALLKLRGNHEGSQVFPHSTVFSKKEYALPENIDEEYDLLVVGAGLSGLTAAFRFSQSQPDAKILIVDNHDDFGGHAKRNEFTVGHRTLITYGGSESLDSPQSTFSDDAHQVLKDLGVDYTKFEHYFDQDLYTKKWGLSEGVFFNQQSFGENKVVQGQPSSDAENVVAIIRQFPMDSSSQTALIQLYTESRNWWEKHTLAQREQWADEISYYDFLKNTVKLPEKALLFLKNLSSEYWGHAINALSVRDALGEGYPGVQHLGLDEPEHHEEEPYIYHFPDGNASIARLLVRKLIPSVTTGNTMEDIVTAVFDYHQLDLAENRVKIRLNTTALHLKNDAQGVAAALLTYGSQTLHRIQAKKCIFAGHSALAPRIIPEMNQAQQQAALSNVKVPMLYAKIAMKNAHAFKKLGVYTLYAPDAPYCLVMLDYPVSMGDYQHAQTPDEPIIVHAVRIASSFSGQEAREMYRNGRKELIQQNYETLEQELREQLRAIYAQADENLDDVLLGITINRWAHGYSYEQVSLFDSDEHTEQTTTLMQQPIGQIYFAGSDVNWQPYMQGAMDQACRAVREALA